MFATSTGLAPVKLPSSGGILILLNASGERVDRVDYTANDLKRIEKNYGKGMPIFFATYRAERTKREPP